MAPQARKVPGQGLAEVQDSLRSGDPCWVGIRDGQDMSELQKGRRVDQRTSGAYGQEHRPGLSRCLEHLATTI